MRPSPRAVAVRPLPAEKQRLRGCTRAERGPGAADGDVTGAHGYLKLARRTGQQFRRDLRAGRFRMDFAQSAPIALQRIADAAGVSLILILSDINMPGMNGLELLPKAKTLRPDVPVIMITAYGDAETKRKAFENGAEALLTKPIDFAELRNEIDMRVEGAERC
jgi:CheY-like chemotaxis protein